MTEKIVICQVSIVMSSVASHLSHVICCKSQQPQQQTLSLLTPPRHSSLVCKDLKLRQKIQNRQNNQNCNEKIIFQGMLEVCSPHRSVISKRGQTDDIVTDIAAHRLWMKHARILLYPAAG